MYAQVRHPWRTWPVRVIPKGRFTLLASCSSQSFVYLALSIQRSPARSRYLHVSSGPPSVLNMACTRYTERRIYAAGFLLFAVLCLSGTFDTTLAGTQQVLPCMFSCAIRGAHGQYALYRKAELALLALSTSQYFVYLRLSATFDTTLAGTQQVHPCILSCATRGAHALYALYRKADLRCWLPALRSPLFICHFRYTARRHAASTSMYVQVRHPWHTRPVRVIPKGELALLAPNSQLPALGSRLSALGSQLPAPSSQLPAPSSQLRTPSPQFFKQ